MRSESIKEIAGALSKAQAEIKPAEMDSTNPFLRNKYASLGAVIEAIRPVLIPNGLSYTQIVESQDTQIGITTVLMHISGEWIESTVFMPLGAEKGFTLVQAAGSIITYLRRYSLSALFGVYAEEDTDAEKLKAAPKQEPTKQAPSTAKMSLETAVSVVSSNGQKYGEIDTAKLSTMAYAQAKKIKAGEYSLEELEDKQFRLDAIRVILASDR